MTNGYLEKVSIIHSKAIPILVPIDLFLSHPECLSLKTVDGIFMSTTRDADKPTSCG